MKKLIIAIVSAALMMLSQSEAGAQLSKLSFGDYQISSVSATSFTSLDGTLSIVVTNLGRKLTLTGISGIVYKQGIPFIIGSADDLVIPAGTSTINVNGHASLQSMSALFAFLSDPSIDPASYTIDATANVKTRKGPVTISKKGVALSTLLKAK